MFTFAYTLLLIGLTRSCLFCHGDRDIVGFSFLDEVAYSKQKEIPMFWYQPARPPAQEESISRPSLIPFRPMRRVQRKRRHITLIFFSAICLSLIITLFWSDGSVSAASASVSSSTRLPIPGATNTLAKFLKQGKIYSPFDGMHVAPANSPLTKTKASTVHSPAQTTLPSAEPAAMKATSQTIPASSVTASTTSACLLLSGSDSKGVRMEVTIPAGTLDFSIAKTATHVAPSGNLTITLTQAQGYYLTATTELSSFKLQITDAQ